MIQSITGLWASLAFFSNYEECKGGAKLDIKRDGKNERKKK
jgi:hypothetical protein